MSKAKTTKAETEAGPAPDFEELELGDVLGAGSSFAPDPGSGPGGASIPAPASSEDRLSNLERLQIAAEARKVTGHRDARTIQADIEREKAKFKTMVRERDIQAERETKEAKIHAGMRTLGKEAWLRAGVPWNEAEWAETQKVPFRVPLQFLDDLHRQHYVVAKFEAELEALRAATGAASYV